MLTKKAIIELKKEDIVADATLDKPKAEKKEAAKEDKKESTDDSKAESKPAH